MDNEADLNVQVEKKAWRLFSKGCDKLATFAFAYCFAFDKISSAPGMAKVRLAQ